MRLLGSLPAYSDLESGGGGLNNEEQIKIILKNVKRAVNDNRIIQVKVNK